MAFFITMRNMVAHKVFLPLLLLIVLLGSGYLWWKKLNPERPEQTENYKSSAGVIHKDTESDAKQESQLLEIKVQNPDKSAPLTDEEITRLTAENEAARQRAEIVLREVLRPDGDFSALAKQYSDDPGSKESGGDIGWVKKGQTVPEFDKAIFEQLKPGEITKEILKTQFGYHIIRKLAERDDSSVANGENTKEVRVAHILFRARTENDLKQEIEEWLSTGLTSKQLKQATIRFSDESDEPSIELKFTADGAKLLAQITEANTNKPIAVFLDGAPLSIPIVNRKIGDGKLTIYLKGFTADEATHLAQRLNAEAERFVTD